MQFFMVCFSCIYVSSLAGGRMDNLPLLKRRNDSAQRPLAILTKLLFIFVSTIRFVLVKPNEKLSHPDGTNYSYK